MLREALRHGQQQIRLPDQLDPCQKSRNGDHDVSRPPRRRKLCVHRSLKAAVDDGDQRMLGTAIPLPIKSAAAERVARPHDDDIALLRPILCVLVGYWIARICELVRQSKSSSDLKAS